MTHFKSEEWRQALLITQDLRAAMSQIDGTVEDWQHGMATAYEIVDDARRYRYGALTVRLMRALEGLDGAPDTQPLWAAHAALWGLDRGDAGITPAIILGRLRDAKGVLERVYWAGMCDAPPSRDAWIYHETMLGKPWAWIRENIRITNDQWYPVETDNGVKDVAERYAKDNNLPAPEKRKPGRRRNTK